MLLFVRFDFIIVVVPFVCLCIEAILLVVFSQHPELAGNERVQILAYVAMARPIKLLRYVIKIYRIAMRPFNRLLKLKKSYYYLICLLLVLVERLFRFA